MKDGLNIEFTLDKIVYSKDGFTIARVFSNTREIAHTLNPLYRNVSIKGNMPKLKLSVVYKATVVREETSNYGYTLVVDGVYPRDFNGDTINTDEDMVYFIETFIGKGTADKLKDVKGICKMIKEKDINELIKIHGIGKKIANKLTKTYDFEAVGSKYLLKIKRLGFTNNEVKKLNNLFSENYMLAYEQINENIFQLAFKGFQLNRMDEIFLNKMDGDSKDQRRIRCYLWKALKDCLYQDYQSYTPMDTFLSLPIVESIKDNLPKYAFDECMERMIKDGLLRITDNNCVTTCEIYDYDVKLYQEFQRLMRGGNRNYINIDIDKEIKYEENRLGIELNEGQKEAVKSILTHNVSLLTGGGGTGKTFTLKVILAILERIYEPMTSTLVALSGKASRVLAESTGMKAGTIHRTLKPSDSGFYHGADKKLETDILVVDEVSMVSNDLMYHLLSAIKNGTIVVFVGDPNQLLSIGFSNMINDLIKLKVNHAHLTQVMRQAMKSGILSMCTDVRNNKNSFLKKNHTYGELQDMHVTIGKNEYYTMINDFANVFDVNNRMDYSIIGCTKKLTSQINIDIQNALIKNGKLKKSKNFIEIFTEIKDDNNKSKKMKIYKDDVLMIIKNSYDILSEADYEEGNEKGTLSLFNGNTVIVSDIYENAIKVESDGEYYIIPSSKYDTLTSGYSYSIHKSQGSTIPYCYIYLEDNWVTKNLLLCNESFYTAISRAKEDCKLYIEDYSILDKAIKTREINNRSTILELLIDGKIKNWAYSNN